MLIDSDLQDPPELIRDFIRLWQNGSDVVYGVRRTRDGESSFKRGTAAIFYRLLNRISDVEIPLDSGDFRLMSRRVVDALQRMPERDRFLRGMVAWTGFVQTPLHYDRARRVAGTTKYPFWKMMRFALDGITAFTTIPLRLATWAGAVAALIALAGVFYALFVRLFFDNWVPGWAAIFVAVAFFSGAQLMALGVIGEYLGRVFLQMKGRPLYVLSDLSPTQVADDCLSGDEMPAMEPSRNKA